MSFYRGGGRLLPLQKDGRGTGVAAIPCTPPLLRTGRSLPVSPVMAPPRAPFSTATSNLSSPTPMPASSPSYSPPPAPLIAPSRTLPAPSSKDTPPPARPPQLRLFRRRRWPATAASPPPTSPPTSRSTTVRAGLLYSLLLLLSSPPARRCDRIPAEAADGGAAEKPGDFSRETPKMTQLIWVVGPTTITSASNLKREKSCPGRHLR